MPDITKSTSLDLSQGLIFCIVFVAMCVLVGLGKVDADKLQSHITLVRGALRRLRLVE